MKAAIFLDRDGILNEVVMRGGVVGSPRTFAEFRLIPDAALLVQSVRAAGFVPVVVTNQPDIGRGLMAEADLALMHAELERVLGLSEIEVAIGGDDSDPRRKPAPGMLLDAAGRLGLDLSASWIVGDSIKDLEAGARAGVKTVLLETGYNSLIHGKGTLNFCSLKDVARFIKEQSPP